MTFSRQADRLLNTWYAYQDRKPLILRGARQTGKSTAVRGLGAQAPLFLELNLERHQDLALIRTCRSAEELLERLQQHHNLAELPPGTLIFLDEIQEFPEALRWLRFLYEDHPQLAVVAAGSLLEVRLRDDSMPFPVGRVEFLRLEPLTFLDFLDATDDQKLASDLRSHAEDPDGVPEGLHHLAMERFRRFLLIGGMPEAVAIWKSNHNLVEVGRVHNALHQAYLEDLLKYGLGSGIDVLQTVLAGAPAHFGNRFKNRSLVPGEKDKPVAKAIDLLERAMVLHRVLPTNRTELPLLPRPRAARKLLPLDIGLALAQLGVKPEHLQETPVESVLDGRVAEAFVGLQLLARNPEQARSLFFWAKESSSGTSAEVDYLWPTDDGVVPVEVKSGPTGRLKSMHQYLTASGGGFGYRLTSSCGGREELEVNLPQGGSLRYTLRTMPLYLAEVLG